jgi:hypothetical protein
MLHSVPMSSRFTKKLLVSVSDRRVRTPCSAWPVFAEDARAADEHRHLWGRQRKQARPIDPHLHRSALAAGSEVVAKALSRRLEYGEGVGVGLLGRGIRCAVVIGPP